jgi:trimeric autotransporter adhesin
MKHVTFHLPSFLRRVRIHGGEFDSSARAMNREKQVRLLQAEPRIVRGSTIERKYMSTTIKRIALVAVAALGFGVLSVVPSQADVSGLEVTATNGTATELNSDSSTAAVLNIKFLALAGKEDSVTVSIVQAAARPALSTNINGAGIFWTESTTSLGGVNHPLIDTNTAGAASSLPVVRREAITPNTAFRVTAPDVAGAVNGTFSVKVKFSLGETTTSVVKAGTYSFNAIVGSNQAGARVSTVVPFNIVVSAVAVPATAAPVAAQAKAYLHAGDVSNPGDQLADSATAGSFVAGTRIGTIRVTNFSAPTVAAYDTITVTMTGVGYLQTTAGPSPAFVGRSFVVTNEDILEMDVRADGSSGTGTITISTVAGASFVKTVTFFDTKIAKATATVSKAFIKAGATTAGVFSVVVTDTIGTGVTGLTVAAAPTDTATTVGGAATCAYSATKLAYICDVTGLSATKFGPVAYTITATGNDAAKTKVTTTASVTFSDNVATKAVLAGPATGTPGATVEYTLTLTDKNGYAVADQNYGAGVGAQRLFSTTAADTVASGWGTLTPFSSSDTYTSVSGVLTSKGTLPIAGVASLSLTLVGDGLQTLTDSGIDKTIGKTKVTVSTETTNPGVDAATDAANEATDAANAATDAALAAAEAADAATTAAQEASDAVAALSASVTKLIEGLQAQIKSLAAVVAKIAKKVKA